MEFRIDHHPIPTDNMDDYAWISQSLKEFDQNTFGPLEDVQHIFVAHELNIRLGGCATAFRFGWLCIERLWVDPQYRGNSIGSSLLITAEDMARKKSLLGLRLVTTDRHTGLTLYLRQGFSVDYRFRGQLADQSPIEEIGLSKKFALCDRPEYL